MPSKVMERSGRVSLFVRRIPQHWTDEDLEQVFRPFGNFAGATCGVVRGGELASGKRGGGFDMVRLPSRADVEFTWEESFDR